MLSYYPKYFKLEELVPDHMFKEIPTPILWGMLDTRILLTLDALRDKFGPVYVNNWHIYGKGSKYTYNYRGLRQPDCGVGAKYSQHKYGRAMDCTFKYVDVTNVRQYIIDSKAKNHPVSRYITCLELDTSWLHFDVRNHNNPANNGILLIRP